MMPHEEYLYCILGMGLVTYLPRWFPLVILSGRNIPDVFRRWLEFIPVSILSALVANAVFIDPSTGGFQVFQKSFFAAVPTLAVALKTRSLGLTVIAGMLAYWGLGYIL
jgi:branched-subunit amino acid transport protein